MGHVERGATGEWLPPIRRARVCGARTRAGGSCRAPAVRGKARCRMHGGAAGSGAQRGNRNAEKHGYWGAAAVAGRARVTALIAAGEDTLRELSAAGGVR